MATPNTPQRKLFAFRMGKRLAEHEAPARASRQSWFGVESDVVAITKVSKSTCVTWKE